MYKRVSPKRYSKQGASTVSVKSHARQSSYQGSYRKKLKSGITVRVRKNVRKATRVSNVVRKRKGFK
jgi:hypothetical protein